MWLYIVVAFVVLYVLSHLLQQKKFDFHQSHVFFVTGCASGVGKRMAEKLLERKQTVIATDINLAQLQAHAAEWQKRFALQPQQLFVHQLDVTKFEQYQQLYTQLLQQHKKIDVHMNIAGYLKPGYAYDFEAREVDRHIDINVKGVIFGTQLAAQHMKQNKAGHIVNMGSTASLVPYPGCSLYGASKYAVRSFTLAVAQELRPFGVKVTCMCPDAIQTPMLDLQVDYEEATLSFSGHKVLTTDDVVNTILDTGLVYQPAQIVIPFPRGWICRLGDLIFGTPAYYVLQNLAFQIGQYQRKQAQKKRHAE